MREFPSLDRTTRKHITIHEDALGLNLKGCKQPPPEVPEPMRVICAEPAADMLGVYDECASGAWSNGESTHWRTRHTPVVPEVRKDDAQHGVRLLGGKGRKVPGLKHRKWRCPVQSHSASFSLTPTPEPRTLAAGC